MLAYSSIGHAGYVLMGFQADTGDGFASALFYLLAYTFMVLGSFAVVSIVGRRGDRRHRLDDYRGLGARQPLLAGALTLFLLAQAGVPLTAGFMAKFSVFSATIDAREYALVIVGVLSAVISMFFYLRLIVLMYMTDPEAGDAGPGFELDAATGTALAVAAVATVVLGVLPGPVLDFARHATLLF
jgi:NADH-quinone oxidoreductase subunit N